MSHIISAFVRYTLTLNLVNLKRFCNNKECVFVQICYENFRRPKISDSLGVLQHPQAPPAICLCCCPLRCVAVGVRRGLSLAMGDFSARKLASRQPQTSHRSTLLSNGGDMMIDAGHSSVTTVVGPAVVVSYSSDTHDWAKYEQQDRDWEPGGWLTLTPTNGWFKR